MHSRTGTTKATATSGDDHPLCVAWDILYNAIIATSLPISLRYNVTLYCYESFYLLQGYSKNQINIISLVYCPLYINLGCIYL